MRSIPAVPANLIAERWGRWFLVTRGKTKYGPWHLEAETPYGSEPTTACHRKFEQWQMTTNRGEVREIDPDTSFGNSRQHVCVTCLRVARAIYGPDSQ